MIRSAAHAQTLDYAPSRGTSYYLIRTTALLLVTGIPVLLFSLANDDYQAVQLYFDYLSTPFLVLCALTEMVLSQRAAQLFAPGEPLRSAWRAIRIAAAFHAIGLVMWHMLGANRPWNPLTYSASLWNEGVARQLQDAGYVFSGPLRMAVLAVGLGLALRAINRSTRLRVTASAYALLVPVALFACYQTFLFVQQTLAAQPRNWARLFDGANEPLLAALLFEALLIYRALSEMGGGLIARCWGAFAAGIVLTCLGTVGEWATNYNYLPWPYSSIVWYVWIPAAAAYALAPAYQLEAAWALRVIQLKSKTRDEVGDQPRNQTRSGPRDKPRDPARNQVRDEPREKAPSAQWTGGRSAAKADSAQDQASLHAAAAWAQTLSPTTTVLGKLAIVAASRNPNSTAYAHQALAHVPADTASQVIRDSHLQLFRHWLSLRLEEQLKDLVEYLAATSGPASDKPLHKSDWENLIPPAATNADKLLFETDLTVVLELAQE